MTLEEYYEAIYQSHPVLRYCERFDETSSKWNFEKHSHPYIELIFFLEGKAGVEVDGFYLDTSLYDTIVYPAGCVHHDGRRGERRREIICLWVDAPEVKLEQPILLHERSRLLRELFKLIYAEGRQKEPDKYILEYLLKLLLTLVVRQTEQGMDSDALMREVIPYIHEHFSERITLDDLAGLQHISKSYLARRFKQYTDMTAVSYINHVRVEAAKDLLIASDYNTSEISYQVGFESPKYFHRVFKGETGESPSAFRKAFRRPRDQKKRAERKGTEEE